MAVVTGVLTITPTTLATNVTAEAGVGLTIAPMDRSQFTVMIVNSICELVLALRDDVITTFMFLPMEKYNVLRMMVMDADCQNQIAFFPIRFRYRCRVCHERHGTVRARYWHTSGYPVSVTLGENTVSYNWNTLSFFLLLASAHVASHQFLFR